MVYIRRPVYYFLVVMLWLAAGLAAADLFIRHVLLTGAC